MDEENNKNVSKQFRHDKALLNIDELCSYLGIGKTKARELLHDPRNKFTVRLGNRLYAHKKKLDEWLEIMVDMR